MDWRSAGNWILVALYAYLAVSMSAGLVGNGVGPWLAVGAIAAAVAVGSLRWGDTVRDWWRADISELYEFAILTAALLCVTPLIAAMLVAPEPALYVTRILAIGLMCGYIVLFVCNQVGMQNRVRGANAE